LLQLIKAKIIEFEKISKKLSKKVRIAKSRKGKKRRKNLRKIKSRMLRAFD